MKTPCARKELEVLTPRPPLMFSLSDPGLHVGERVNLGDWKSDSEVTRDKIEKSKIESSLSLWKLADEHELPWKHSNSTCSWRVETKYTAPEETAGPRTRGF